MRPLTLAETRTRLAAYVLPSGDCWVWNHRVDASGYGIVGDRFRVHRLVYELEYGPIPDGLWVLHRCDNPPCCNPAHLFLGTQAENMADMVAKGRQSRKDFTGVRNPRARLTEDQVRAIRERPGTHQEVADEFGISRAAVIAVRNRRRWRHVA